MLEMIGVARYEYLMQIRRWSLWISGLLLTGLLYFFMSQNVQHQSPAELQQPWQVSDDIVSPWNLLMPVAAGILVADRFTRDHLLGVNDLLRSALPSARTLALGKYVGSLLAVFTPSFLLTVGAVTYLVIALRAPQLFLTSAVVLLAAVLPSWLFVVAWSLFFPLVLPLRLYQVLYVGFWLWATEVPRGLLPTINQTIFTVSGQYARFAFFLKGTLNKLPTDFLVPPATIGWAIVNMSLIIGVALVGLVALELVLRWQERRT
jgi:ABC-2 type transport system permease protein